MLLRKHRSRDLFRDFNTLQFASVMALVVFVLLVAFMTQTTPHYGTAVDLPKVRHAVSMPGALREDVIKVSVTRDGRVYFGVDQVDPVRLPQKIAERLKDRDVERKVYVVADMRARWGSIKPVVDGIRSSGILRVAFLVNQHAS
jgi:biopolymer transport protein ExbD